MLLDGNKWLIVSSFFGCPWFLLPSCAELFHKEHQENETVTLEDVSLSQSVNIFGCNSATILIKGKVNAVNMRTLSL